MPCERGGMRACEHAPHLGEVGRVWREDAIFGRLVVDVDNVLDREGAPPRADVRLVEDPRRVKVAAVVGDVLGRVAVPVVAKLERVDHLGEAARRAELRGEALPQLVGHVVRRDAEDERRELALVGCPLGRVWLQAGQVADGGGVEGRPVRGLASGMVSRVGATRVQKVGEVGPS